MTRHSPTLRALSLSLALCGAPAMASAQFVTQPFATSAGPWGIRHTSYADVIARVERMPNDADLQQRAQRLGLNVVNLMWEDTGRSVGSSLGPNISDVTLQVREDLGPGNVRTHLLPVLRAPNFTDRTGDVPADRLWVRVGNQRAGGALQSVPLTDVLRDLRSYLTNPSSLGGSGNLLASRDTHFLVSAQHVFVPLSSAGRAEFNPVIFNYQSAPTSPAVLTLLITREGTSATVIENRPGDQSLQGWGQQLFFNHAGQKTTFTAERRSAVERRVQNGQAREGDEGALEQGADMLMIVQVPLRHRNVGYLSGEGLSAAPVPMAQAAAGAPSAMRGGEERSDVEAAIIGHGDDSGPFEEARGLALVRDERFPVRVTVQFYKATSNGVVSDADLEEAHRAIERVYEDADYVGSLVVPESERRRPTAHAETSWVPRWVRWWW